jgi:glycosyltransferase involved in cell wall biosynthesis
MKENMQICVIIPAYNEAENVGSVVSEARKFIKDVVVVDDGSTDDTVARALQAGATLIEHKVNKGKGVALKTGFQYVLEKDYDAVITLDADSQHDPAEIPKFLEAAREADVVVGSRAGNRSGMPVIRRISNTLSSWILSGLVGQRLTDTQSGYRLIKAEVLKAAMTKTTGFEAESEILLEAISRGFRVAEIPIKTIYGTEKSHYKWRDGFIFLGLVGKYLLKKMPFLKR